MLVHEEMDSQFPVVPARRYVKVLVTLRVPAPVTVARSATSPRTSSPMLVMATVAGLVTRVVTRDDVAVVPTLSVAIARSW